MKVRLEPADLGKAKIFEVKNFFYQMGGILLIVNDNEEIYFPDHAFLRVDVDKGKKD